MNNLDKQYQDLLKDILENGVRKGDRTGTGTISVFGRTIRHKMSEGFPLLTTKKMYTKGIITELLWFLRGETNIKPLVEANCNIWNGDAYKRYCSEFKKGNAPGVSNMVKIIGQDTPEIMFTEEEFVDMIKLDPEISGNFAQKWGDLGPIYGAQWRRWNTNKHVKLAPYSYGIEVIDQVQQLVDTLFNNPDSRRMMVNAWNPAEVDNCVLPPCHYGFQVYTRELSLDERNNYYTSKYLGLPHTEEILDRLNMPKRAISLAWNQRSVDTFLGLPFNIASYGLLLCILGEITNMIPDELVGFLGDTHLYTNHLEQAKEQITREPYALPVLHISPEFWAPGTEDGCGMGAGTYERRFEALAKSFAPSDFDITMYESHATIKAPLSN